MDKSRKGSIVARIFQNMWRYWSDVIIPSSRLFNRALPLLGCWLLIPICLLLMSAVWQARSTAILSEAQSLQTAVVQFPSTEDKSFDLYVSYPRKALHLPIGTPGGALALWLREASMTPEHTPTPANYRGECQVLTITSTPSITDGQTSTSTPLVVSIQAEEPGITFVDERGLPLDPRVALTPSRFGVTPQVLYLRPADGEGQQSDEVYLHFALDGYPTPTGTAPVRLHVEAKGQAQWRSILDTFLGIPALFGGLLAALVGFVVQQWKSLDEEFKQRQSVQERIMQLFRQLESDPAEGLRQYEKALDGSDPPWSSEWSRAELERAIQREQRVLPQLRILFTLWHHKKFSNDNGLPKDLVEEYTSAHLSEALGWALSGALGEDWAQRAGSLTIKPAVANLLGGEVVKMVEQRALRAVLKPWVEVTFWRPELPFYSGDIVRGLRYPYLKINPFGAEHAEENKLLFDSYYPHHEDLQNICQDVPSLVFGSPGAGKTAAALWLVRENLRRQRFPIYFPTPDEPILPEIARAVSLTLLSYLAVYPAEFTKLSVERRHVIVRLWVCYICEGEALIARLREAGLATTGPGKEVEIEVVERMKGLSASDAPTQDDLLRWLEGCPPAGFDGLRLLVDWKSKGSLAAQKRLGTLLTKLAPFGVFGTVFLPERAEAEGKIQASDARVIELQWTRDHLKGLLKMRLKHAGEESLASWCDPLAAQTDSDERMVMTVSTPGELIRKGNTLLSWIDGHGKKLSREALDDILGPLLAQ